jgi:hypothetical protein
MKPAKIGSASSLRPDGPFSDEDLVRAAFTYGSVLDKGSLS